MDYAKIDKLTAAYIAADNKARWLEGNWGDMPSDEAACLYQEILKYERDDTESA